ncbi:MAG: hypoxanthine phosphoribosyltransferase [Candidatus Marinimicrobia bacterium]|nr:hypoxanthine phosphoribosyltransferase [Candidatus Neomarinimicrobiota bacterium]
MTEEELKEHYARSENLELVITKEEIQKKIDELAVELEKDYKTKNPILIGVLNGSFIFMADLIRRLELDCEVDFIKISSYADSTRTSGTVRLIKDISADITGRHVLIVEDIVDTGLTVRFLKRRMEESGTKSVEFVSLLFKETEANAGVDIKYIGFHIPDRFVVGYGLDYAQRLRRLESIYAMRELPPV